MVASAKKKASKKVKEVLSDSDKVQRLLKKIRRHCLGCSLDAEDVSNCPIKRCDLYRHRNGSF